VISEADALDRILASIEPLPAESLPVEHSAGRFAAGAVHSPAPLPRFDQSSMDGYAIRSADTPGTLRLVGEQPAGAARALHVGSGETVRIFTGAPLPRGADAVVMQEDVESGESGIRIAQAVPPGEFIRRRGGDVCEGQQLIASGEPLTAPRIGLLCAAGITSIAVHRRPRIAIVTTGDELRQPDSALAPGELFDSNGPMLAAQLAAAAGIIGTAHTPDDPTVLAGTIQSFERADAIIIGAGVSVGDHDPVHEALRLLNATVEFWRVAVKPGKPFLFARLGAQRIFGLPGNPVSAFVTAHLFVEPALLRLAGASLEKSRPHQFQIPLGTRVENPDARPHYLRATLRDGAAFPTPLQQSHALSGLATADFLIRIDAHSSVDKGSPVPTFPLHFR
jgi:molybdopterin molybdotransferase